MDLFKKSVIVGVAVSPERGLEVAQIDFTARRVLKYGSKPLDYNVNTREIADLDLFKDSLQDLLMELDIPKNAEIVLNVPAGVFKVNDYPAALDEIQITNAIEEDLQSSYLFQDREACSSAAMLPNSSMQFNKIAYTAASKGMILEIALIIQDLGYKIYAIDTNVNSTLNALIYLDRVNTDMDTNWVMVVVENYCCRVLSMLGNSYLDTFEERISIGEVLGDSENYSTVINAIEPILKNIPSKYLCVVSKTNVISAEILANKITYSAPITYQEANNYAKEAFLSVGPTANPETAGHLSIDVIGASIYKDFAPFSAAQLNLFNKSLGDIYTSQQPPELFGGRIVLTNEFLLKSFIIIAIIVVSIAAVAFIMLSAKIHSQQQELDSLNLEIQKSQKFLKDNESISSDLFDEGDEIRVGLEHNKAIYSYYTIVGTEIPKKLWLTHIKFDDKTTIEGQADNLESVYGFFRSIKDYNPESDIKLQKLGLATNSRSKSMGDNFDTESLLTSMNADFYEFKISNEPEISKDDLKKNDKNSGLPDLEPIKE